LPPQAASQSVTRPAVYIVQASNVDAALRSVRAVGAEATQQLEIIRPAGGADATYSDALPRGTYATSLHHFGRLITDAAQWEAVQASVLGSGLATPVRGAFCYEGTPLMHYLYADARQQLGHYLEFMYRTEAGRDIFAQVPRF